MDWFNMKMCFCTCFIHLLANVQSASTGRAMCSNPGSEMATLDAPCSYDSNCTTMLCQDGRCGCHTNHYYDSCSQTCQAENNEADQIVAMKAGTTAVGTFILIVVLVIIMVREKNKDSGPKFSSKLKSKKVADDHVNRNSKKTSLAKLKQPQIVTTLQSNGDASSDARVYKTTDDQHVHNSGYVNTGYTTDTHGDAHHCEYITQL